MKITCVVSGDESVGIQDVVVTLEADVELEVDADRERLRASFEALVAEEFDGGAGRAWFDDECPDCHRAESEGHEHGCPSDPASYDHLWQDEAPS